MVLIFDVLSYNWCGVVKRFLRIEDWEESTESCFLMLILSVISHYIVNMIVGSNHNRDVTRTGDWVIVLDIDLARGQGIANLLYFVIHKEG